MSGVSGYLIKIVSAAVLCGILNYVTRGKGALSSMLKMISGIFIAVTVLSPLINIRFDHQIDAFNKYFETGMLYSGDGAAIATEQKSEFIKSATQTYILDKAVSLGAELEVEVILGDGEDDPYEAVLLRGKISPYAKEQLSLIIAKDLGISEEAQQWIN